MKLSALHKDFEEMRSLLKKPEKREKRTRKPIARNYRPQRGKRPAKESKKHVPALKRRLWNLFRQYIRDRDGNVCVSCGKGGLEGKGWHAGHLFPAGQHNVIRFEPKNVSSQCYHCNMNLGGNGAAFAQTFIDRYGVEEFMRLSERSKVMKQWRAPELEELIAALEKSGADYEMLYAEKYGLTTTQIERGLDEKA